MNTILEEDLDIIAESEVVSEYYGKTILITGATGLIGSLLIKSFSYCNRKKDSNICVIGTARDAQKVDNLFSEVKDKNLSFVFGSIEEPMKISGDIDYIFHTANPTVSKYFITNPTETIHSIYTGTRNMLELTKEKGSAMTYLSSMEVYGSVPYVEGHRTTEDELGKIDIMNVRSCYPEGKRLAECMCRSYFEQYGAKVNIARLAQTFGAGVLKNDNRIFMQFVRSAINNQDIVMHTKGESYGNYCYTRDTVLALFALLLKGEYGEAYNVVNESATMRIVDMAHLVSEKIAEKAINVVTDIPDENKYGYAKDTKLMLSGDKIQKLGWIPEVSLEEAFRRLKRYIEVENDG